MKRKENKEWEEYGENKEMGNIEELLWILGFWNKVKRKDKRDTRKLMASNY